LSHQATFPAQIHDCKAAIRWLRAHAEEFGLDPERIGAWGSSAGGHLAALLGTSGDVPELEGAVGTISISQAEFRRCATFTDPRIFWRFSSPGRGLPTEAQARRSRSFSVAR
jgi:acetyl esterase/lipase